MSTAFSDTTTSQSPVPRRAFMQTAAASAAAAGLLLAGCSDDEPTPAVSDPNLLTLGAGDGGLLNYAYLLEQLEAAFYEKVLATPPTDWQAGEKAYFDDLRDHEVIHRETLAFALGNAAIPALTFDFSTLTLTTRAGVLAAAKKLEDTGVAAYNGVARLISNTTILGLVAKISAVEARHASLVRDLLTPGSFAGTDVVISTSILSSVAQTLTPTEVIAAIAPFLLPVKVNINSLPTA